MKYIPAALLLVFTFLEAKIGWLKYETFIYRNENMFGTDTKTVYNDFAFKFIPSSVSFGVIVTL